MFRLIGKVENPCLRRLSSSRIAKAAEVQPEEKEHVTKYSSEFLQVFLKKRIKLRTAVTFSEVAKKHAQELKSFAKTEDLPSVVFSYPAYKAEERAPMSPFQEPETTSKPAKKAKSTSTKKSTSKSATKEKKSLDQLSEEELLNFTSKRGRYLEMLAAYFEACGASGRVSTAVQSMQIGFKAFKKQNLERGAADQQIFSQLHYRILFSACADNRDFKNALTVQKLMLKDEHSLDAVCCGFLLAAARERKDCDLVCKWITESGIDPAEILSQTPFSGEDRRHAHQILTSTLGLKIPLEEIEIAGMARQTYRSPLLKDLAQQTVKHERREPFISPEKLREKIDVQWNREKGVTVEIPSIYSTHDTVTEKTKLIRGRIADLEARWRERILESFKSRIASLLRNSGRSTSASVLPILLTLNPEQLATLCIQEIRSNALSANIGIGLTNLALCLGRTVEHVYQTEIHKKNGIEDKLRSIFNEYCLTYDHRETAPARELWNDIVRRRATSGPSPVKTLQAWPTPIKLAVGKFFYDIILELDFDISLTDESPSGEELMNAFYTVYKLSKVNAREEIRPHDRLTELYREANIEKLFFDVTALPMKCPPKPWTMEDNGTPFLLTKMNLVRINDKERDLTAYGIHNEKTCWLPTLDALNVLGKVPWIMNKPMLDTVKEIFLTDSGLHLSIYPHPRTLEAPVRDEEMDNARWNKVMTSFRNKKGEYYALWCDMLYKLSIADDVRDDIFWFPYNVDFRGRIYPCPPHFNHLGSDAVRSMLLFAEGKPLGPEGFRWLKLHLVNLTGLKKRNSLEERLEYFETILDEVIDSAKNPLTGRRWWEKSDDPFQTLAACMEIVKVLESGVPHEEYICHFPIHQDGSCNGLQHYAALGRDVVGAMQVNLTPSERPQDVYNGVAGLVEELRAADAADGNKTAKILEGCIQRKVVKRPIMTVVYGVTRYGAVSQILKEIEDNGLVEERSSMQAARYLAEKTFVSLRRMFKSARRIQTWFDECSKFTSVQLQKPMTWVTPLGFPVLQPYFKSAPTSMVIHSGASKSSRNNQVFYVNAQVNPMKQKNAFAPNFIHSLDSTHMMLTAIYCQAAGVHFVSVHDCFWTHPSSVSTMSKICREQFVAMHKQPILEDLLEHINEQVEAKGLKNLKAVEHHELINAIPEKGKLNLEEVLDSVYFFS